MSNLIICKQCGSTISSKYFIFHEAIVKNPNIDRIKLYKKLNITRTCCKTHIMTSLPDVVGKKMMLNPK